MQGAVDPERAAGRLLDGGRNLGFVDLCRDQHRRQENAGDGENHDGKKTEGDGAAHGISRSRNRET